MSLGKQISTLICQGSKSGDYSVQVDGAPAANLSGYKDPGPQGDQCIISQTFDSGLLADGSHSITIIVKGSHAAPLANGTAVEFGGFMYVKVIILVSKLTEVATDTVALVQWAQPLSPSRTFLPSLVAQLVVYSVASCYSLSLS